MKDSLQSDKQKRPQDSGSSNNSLATLQYLYFLRFSLLLLLATPALALVDRFTGINSITRGFFVPAEPWDFIGEAFFLACVGAIALVTSRLVVLNGNERYDVEPPKTLQKLLGATGDEWAGWVLIAYQLPGMAVLAYLLQTSRREQAQYSLLQATAMSLIGIALSLIFWASLTIIYYWTAEDGTGFPPRTILLPRSCFGVSRTVAAQQKTVLSPPAFISNIWKAIARLGDGYASKTGQLYSGHQFAGIAAFGYLLIYLLLFPLTSPYTAGPGYRLSLAVFAFVALASCVVAVSLNPPSMKWAKYLIAFELLSLSLGALGLLTGVIKPSETFPVLCSILVLLTLIALLTCALAFFLDKIHIPVILATVAVVVLLHGATSLVYLLPGLNNNARLRGFSDHYFEVLDQGHAPNLASPIDVVAGRTCPSIQGTIPCPIILISATGGGIHAAAWTTEMLTELEDGFRRDAVLAPKGFSFHENVALFSTVSGGSVGLLPFLSEYYADRPFDPEQWEARKERMFVASACSGLESVAWGLEYRDFDTFLLPPSSGFFSPKWDRSFALEASIRRHLFEKSCKPLDKGSVPSPLFSQEKTLGDFADGLRTWADQHGKVPIRYVPAFSMNTTAAETGGRFLLSNYHVIPNVGLDDGVAPAEDFLHAYGERQPRAYHPNIGISTAARLSATFPYVSSAARSDQMKDDEGTLHFVDGGYYDNDGIATAIEFLLAAQPGFNSATTHGTQQTVPILLIEIRDGSDLDEQHSLEEKAAAPHKPKEKAPYVWNSTRQISAPLEAFWAAGHTAVSRRNRRELEVLMNSLDAKHVAFSHIVLDYKDSSDTDKDKAQQIASQPLSWFLTPYQISRLRAARTRLEPCIVAATTWTANALTRRPDEALANNTRVVHCAP